MQKLLYIVSVFFLVGCTGSKEVVNNSGENNEVTHSQAVDDAYLMALFIEANKEKMLDNYYKATSLFEACLEIDPDHSASHFELSNLYAAQGRMSTALSHAQAAAEGDPENMWYQSQMGNLYAATGNNEEAAKVFKTLSEEYPENIDFPFMWAESLLYANDVEGAIKAYDFIEKSWGINPDLSIQKQMLYEELGEDEKGMAEIEKLIEWNPNEPRYRGLLAELYAEQGRRDEAFAMYNSIFDIDPDNGMANMALAMFYQQEDNQEKYWEHLKIGFVSDDVNIDQKMGVVLDYYDRTTWEPNLLPQAYELLDLMIAAHPKDPKSYSIKGDFMARDDSLMQARDLFLKALELDPNKNLIWNEVMALSFSLEDFDALLRDSEKAIELYPSMSRYYYYNGVANIQKKNYQEAVESLRMGKSLLYEDYNLLFLFWQSLGDAYNFLEEYGKSDDAYDHALDLNPDNVYVLNNYAYYLSLRNEQLTKAAEMSLQCNELEPGNASFQDTYGWILYQQGSYAEAQEWIGKALESAGPGNGVILEHYGDVLFQQGNSEEALEYWKQAQKAGNASEFIDRKVADKQLYE